MQAGWLEWNTPASELQGSEIVLLFHGVEMEPLAAAWPGAGCTIGPHILQHQPSKYQTQTLRKRFSLFKLVWHCTVTIASQVEYHFWQKALKLGFRRHLPFRCLQKLGTFL